MQLFRQYRTRVQKFHPKSEDQYAFTIETEDRTGFQLIDEDDDSNYGTCNQ